MKLVAIIWQIALASSIAGCQAVIPIALVNAGVVAQEESSIGDRSVPENSHYVGIWEGIGYHGGVRVGEKLDLFIVPYNARAARERNPSGPFVIALQFRDYKYTGPRSIRVYPNTSLLRLPSGEALKPMGYQIIPHDSKPPGCYPGTFRGSDSGQLINDTEGEDLSVRSGSYCIEVYFKTAVVAPDQTFYFVTPIAAEGSTPPLAQELKFVKHYGR